MFDVIRPKFRIPHGRDVGTTFKLSFFALAGGIFLGMLVGLAQAVQEPLDLLPDHGVCQFVLRNIPLILVIFWFYFCDADHCGYSPSTRFHQR
jgi:ABC-type amino acid transport system permease subunit